MKLRLPDKGFCFFCECKPASYQGSKDSKRAYKHRLESSFKRYYTGMMPDIPLFANIYHFYNEDVKIDADNISKPTWDALTNVAFSDDKQIIIRSAASIDMRSGTFEIDPDSVPADIRYDFLEAIHIKPHTVFIEVGEMKTLENLFNQSSLWK